MQNKWCFIKNILCVIMLGIGFVSSAEGGRPPGDMDPIVRAGKVRNPVIQSESENSWCGSVPDPLKTMTHEIETYTRNMCSAPLNEQPGYCVPCLAGGILYCAGTPDLCSQCLGWGCCCVISGLYVNHINAQNGMIEIFNQLESRKME